MHRDAARTSLRILGLCVFDILHVSPPLPATRIHSIPNIKADTCCLRRMVKIFPVIFQEMYGFSAGMSGVAFSIRK